jgi:hypothetical protein
MDIRDMMNPRLDEEAIKPIPEEELEEAIKLGYLIVNSSSPASDDLVLDARGELAVPYAVSNNSWASHVPGRGTYCTQLFEKGFDVSHYFNWCFSG